jgi:putrescine transport system substrate-binding protein
MKSPLHVLILLAAASALALAGAAARAAEEEKVLNVYNWSDYIADDTVKNFERETGIKVHYDNFDSNEILHSKLVAGRSGYDIVVPSSSWARVQIQNNLYAPLDKSQLPNLKYVDPAVAAQLARIDPGNAHVVDWLWGFTTVGINAGKVRAALGTLPMPANAWDLLFKLEYVARLKSCGVSLLDSGDEVIPAALHYLGRPIDSKDPADYRKALELLRGIRPSVTMFSSSSYINDMASGRVCLALGWSGDINIARRRAIDNKTGQDIQALMPATGGLLFFDVMAIPADAPHKGNALKWINYILRPQVDAALTNKVFYANPNVASRQFIAPAIARDHTVFPSATEIAGMVGVADALSPDVRHMRTRTFTSFKTER